MLFVNVGGLAEVAASIIYVPSEVLKTRLILAPPYELTGHIDGNNI